MTPEQQRAIALANARRRQAEAMQQAPQIGARSVIATTPDGGQVLRKDDGSMTYVSPGFSTNDPDRIAQILQGATPAETMRKDIDEELIAENPIVARAAKVVQGVPFVGEYADELAGVMVSPRAAENMRLIQDAMQRQRPGQSLAAGLTGGIIGSIPMVASGAGLVAKASGPIQRTAAAAGLGAVAGGAEGVVSGYGSGRDAESRAQNAQTRGLVGAGMGGALGAAAPAVAAGAGNLLRRFKRLDTRVIADEFGIDTRAAAVVKRYLANDDFDAAQAALARAGEGSMLADAGQATGQLMDTAMSSGGAALRIGREATESRAAAQGARMRGVLDEILGTPDGIRQASRDIAQRTATVRRQAYDAAYSRPIDYASEAGRKIEGVLARIPGRTMQAAIREANEAMQADEIFNMQVMAQIADDGTVAFREMPNVQQLDFIKRALGGIAEQERDQLGNMTAAGLRAQTLAADLRNAIGEAVPAYKRALRLGGDKIAEDQALRMGRELLTRRVSVEDARNLLSGASKEANLAARRGLREGIEDTISTVRRAIGQDNVEAKEAMTLVRDMSSRANKAKVRLLLGGKEAERLFKELDEAAAALELRATVARGSQTALRIQGRQAIDEVTAPGPVGQLLEASPVEASRSVVRSLTGATPQARAAQQDALFEQIARALTEKRGAEAQAALAKVRAAMEGQPLKDEDVRQIMNAVGVPALAGLLQAGPQYQRTREASR